MDGVVPWARLEGLYDMHSMRDFAGLDLARDAIPPSRGLQANPCRAVDKTTILKPPK